MEKDIAGEYLLHNVREVATGFLLQPDQGFQFFFSYGALDRQSVGTWEQKGDVVIFNSRKWSGKDFTLVSSRPAEEEEGIIVKLDPPNPMLAAYLHLSLANGAADSWVQFRQQGYLHLPPQEFSSLSIQFEFCPERFTTIPAVTGHQHYIIRPEASLFELFLDQFKLVHTGAGLTGRHPLMEGEFVYEKTSRLGSLP